MTASSSVLTADQAQRFTKLAQEAPAQTVLAATRLFDVATQREHLAPLFTSVLDTLATLAARIDTPTLAADASGYEAILHMLEQPETLAELQPRDPLAPARLRGLKLKRQLLAEEGGVVSAQAFADALGVSRQAVDKRRKQGTLIALSLGRRGYAYPLWQIDLPGLSEVLGELRDLDPWTQTAFMLAPNRWLDGASPLSILRERDVARVLAAARLYGEQVAA